MVDPLALGVNTLPSNASWEIGASIYSSWGDYATRSWFYECLYFEQFASKAKVNRKEGL